MPSSAALRKKRGCSPKGAKEENESLTLRRPKQESLASKLKKRMLEESAHDDLKSPVKHIRTESDCRAEKDATDIKVDMSWDLQGGQCSPRKQMTRIFERLHQSCSLAHYLYAASLGVLSAINRKSVQSPVIRELQDLRLFRTASPFDRRVTALDWHPTMPHMVVAGSKGGDLIFWNTLHQNLNDCFIQGIGPGGSIQALKIWPWNMERILTASIDGTVMLRDWDQRHCQVLSDTMNSCDYWYCCVDVSAPRKVVVTGNNVGNALLLSPEGKKLWTYRLHKQKVTHAEFSPRDDWLLCTASTDTTVKVWDLRQVSGPKSALYVLKHDKAVNSAYFSRTDGCRLLTTDQYSQIRMYLAPTWHLEQTVEHPHRFFQHITPIKATWHSLQDFIVVGRYPCKDFPGYMENERRTIDIIDASEGKMVCQLHDPSAPGLVSLNKFNDRGDYLVSSMGLNLLLWGRSQEVEDRRMSLLAKYQFGDLDPLRSGRRSASRRRSSPLSKQKKAKDTDVKVKINTKTKPKLQKR